MSKENVAYFLAVGFLAVLLVFPLAMPTSFKMDETVDPLFQKIPMSIESWSGKDVKLDERTYEILETRNILSRIYETPEGRKVHLLLVGSHKDRRVAHPPEVCYLSSHYNIVAGGERSLSFPGLTGESKTLDSRFRGNDIRKITVKEFVAKDERRNGSPENVLYLYKIGDRFTTNYYAQQLLFAWDRLTSKKSQVLLIRLAGPDKSVFDEFLSKILPLLPS